MLPEGYPNDILLREGIGVDTAPFLLNRRLRKCADELMVWALNRLAAVCAHRGISPVVLCIPGLNEEPAESRRIADRLKVLVDRAGLGFVDISDAYEGLEKFRK